MTVYEREFNDKGKMHPEGNIIVTFDKDGAIEHVAYYSQEFDHYFDATAVLDSPRHATLKQRIEDSIEHWLEERESTYFWDT